MHARARPQTRSSLFFDGMVRASTAAALAAVLLPAAYYFGKLNGATVTAVRRPRTLVVPPRPTSLHPEPVAPPTLMSKRPFELQIRI